MRRGRSRRESKELPRGASPPVGATPETAQPLLELQAVAGNEVVDRLVERRIQPKLVVGAARDPAEFEADRVANAVLRRLGEAHPLAHEPAHTIQQGSSPGDGRAIRRTFGFEMEVPAAGGAAIAEGVGGPIPVAERGPGLRRDLGRALHEHAPEAAAAPAPGGGGMVQVNFEVPLSSLMGAEE